MEKYNAFIQHMPVEVYLASEVDATLVKVRALVEAAKRVQVDYDTLCVYVDDPLVRWRTYQVTVNAVIQAIAAVERLEK